MTISPSSPKDEVPGTVYLVDQNEMGSGGVILSPTPSSDPEDPLNWTKRRKLMAMGMSYLYTFSVGIVCTVQYSVLPQLSEDTGITVAQLVLGTSLMFLFLGWGCLFWQPIALAYGRRGVFVVSCALCVVPMVWALYSKTVGEWYAHRILLGFLASPIESLPQITASDLYFAHQRGSYIGFYAFLLFGSNFLAPFLAGFINDGAGWRWVFNFASILAAVTAVILFFFMEDTTYFRSTTTIDGEARPSDLSTGEQFLSSASKDMAEVKATSTPTRSDNGSHSARPASHKLGSRLALFRVLPGCPSKEKIIKQSLRPLLIMYKFPIVSWAGLLYGTSLSWYLILNATMATILGSPPYNFSAAMVGVAYLSPLVGAALSSIWSGNIADAIMLRLARRNNGVREPEQRLWALLISGLFTTSGLILWGVGAAHQVHYMGLIFGVGMLTFGVVCGGSISIAYDVDCYKELAGETMISVIIIRNTLGFGFGYAITPWVESLGYQNCFIGVAMVALCLTATFLLMVIFGKKLRQSSAAAYWKYVSRE